MVRNLTVGKGIGIGFGVMLAALAAVVVLALAGIGGTADRAQKVIDGQALEASLAQRELDHLEWLGQVGALLTDGSVTELAAEAGDHRCAFGKWLYSDARREAEGKVEALAPLLKQIEAPHRELHESAVRMSEAHRQADAALPGLIVARQVEQLSWAGLVRDGIVGNAASLADLPDPARCGLCKWLAGERGVRTRAGGGEAFGKAWDALAASHAKLHDSARKLGQTYAQVHPGLEQTLTVHLRAHRSWVDQLGEATIAGQADLGVATDPPTCAYGALLTSKQWAEYSKRCPALHEALTASRAPHEKLHESATRIAAALAKGPAGRAEAERIFERDALPALGRFGECVHASIAAERKLVEARRQALQLYNEVMLPLLTENVRLLDQMKLASESGLEGIGRAEAVFASQTMPKARTVQALLREARRRAHHGATTSETVQAAASDARRNVAAVAAVGIVASIAIAVGILLRALRRMAPGPSAGAEEAAAAAEQVSSVGQALARRAAEQAGGLHRVARDLPALADSRPADDEAKCEPQPDTSALTTGARAFSPLRDRLARWRNKAREEQAAPALTPSDRQKRG